MGKPQFDISIGADGQVRVKVSGASGEECIALTDMLREIVGREESRAITPEYYGSDGDVRTQAEVEGRTKG